MTLIPAVADVAFIDFDRKDAAIAAGWTRPGRRCRIREVLAAWPGRRRAPRRRPRSLTRRPVVRVAPVSPRAPAWHVCVLRCCDGSLYTGATNVARRSPGTSPGGRAARARLPVVLVYSERAGDRSAALRREAAVKRLTRAEKVALVTRKSRGGRGAKIV